MTKLYYATCDKFDDSRTGYYGSKRAALAAFWAENVFSAAERARARRRRGPLPARVMGDTTSATS